jgi:hypothetical protein
MTAERLLRLYPRAWRERYGDEFLAITGEGRLGPQQTIDIVSGAIDAWLSADVRNATRAAGAAPSGGTMSMKTLVICDRPSLRYTTRDGVIGAGVMLISTLLLVLLGFSAKAGGPPPAGEMLINLAFPASLVLSMPFWLMKGQPWKAQVAIVAGTLAMLVAIGAIASVL